MTELFAPNLEEIEIMIKETEKQMEEAESLAEWRELQHQLNELLEKQKELLLENQPKKNRNNGNNRRFITKARVGAYL